MKHKIILILFAGAILNGCNNSSEKSNNEIPTADSVATDTLPPAQTGDNSMTSLDWAGLYIGKLPCADCKGIETKLQINSNHTYRITRIYIGKSNKMFSDTGSFAWDDAGNKITLQTVSGAYVKFLVGENYLLQLDAEGNEIKDGTALSYRLNKQTEVPETTIEQTKQEPKKVITKEKFETPPPAPIVIEGYKWILIELNGKPVEQVTNAKEIIYFMLDTTQHYITGFGGCNQFFGGYKINEPYQIKFQKMTTTLKACDEMETESELLKMFEKVDNYTLSNNLLSLNKARMAPLARFKRGK